MSKKIWVLVGIGLLWIFGTIYILLNAKTVSARELFNLAFTSIGGFGIVSATILNVWNALDTSRNNLKQFEFQRIENSIKYLERWDSNLLVDARNYTRLVNRKRSNLKDELERSQANTALLNELKNDEWDYEKYVILIFNFWEEIYLSIETNRVDEGILKRAFREVYLNQYDDFEIWIKDTGKKYKEMSKNLKIFYTKWSNNDY